MSGLVQVVYMLICIGQFYHRGYALKSMVEDEDLENQIIIDVGSNITLPCTSNVSYVKTGIYWVRKGAQSEREKVLDDGSLFLFQLKKSDTTEYTCHDEKDDHLLSKVYLYVRDSPEEPANVSVTTYVQHAVITWHQNINSEWEQKMGGALTSIHLRYKKFNSPTWNYFPHHIPPSEGIVNIYVLEPDTNYVFELWSQNKYGSSSHVLHFAKTLSSREVIDFAQSGMKPSSPLNVDAKAWLTALVSILFVINMFVLFMIATYCRMGKSKPMPENDEYSEHIELVPNIIENPVCNVDPRYYEDPNVQLVPSANKLSTLM